MRTIAPCTMLICGTLLIALAGYAPWALSQPASVPCELILTLKQGFLSGEAVRASLELVNHAPDGTYISSELTKPRFRVTREGRPVPRTLYGQWLDRAMQPTTGPHEYSVRSALLKDGVTKKWDYLLSQEYDLTMPGEYHINASCEVGDGNEQHRTVVTSREVVFRISAEPYESQR